MKNRDLKNLLNRAAAAIETPQDLNRTQEIELLEDLTVAAKQLDVDAQEDAPRGRVIVVVFPPDTVEDVAKVATELAEMLQLGQYDAEVFTPQPDLEEFILTRFEVDPLPAASLGLTSS